MYEIKMFSIAAGALNLRAASVFASFALSVAAHMITLPWSPGSVWCCCSKIAEAEAAVSVNEKKCLVMHRVSVVFCWAVLPQRKGSL